MSAEKRFSFGKNWAYFLKGLNEERIVEAEKSLKKKLCLDTLENKVFLDVGCGSGLFSLAAHRLGARVISFDYDQESVACTQYLKDTYGKEAPSWSVQQGSVLDKAFLASLDKADIVYSWGVLHHTGNMVDAFDNVFGLVKPHGKLFISIYNYQGKSSVLWHKIKKMYVSMPRMRGPLLAVCGLWLWKYRMAWDLIRYGNPFKYIMEYGKNNRGMSAWYDLIDWVGGYPFEVAKPEQVFTFFYNRGFKLEKMKTCAGGRGCNEFVFLKG